METLKAVAVARRNLTLRIGLYLADLEASGREPSWREGDRLLEAVELLSKSDFANGERAMMWADVATRQEDAGERHPTLTVQELRRRFEAVDAKRD